MASPLVTVYIPTRNRSGLLARAVDSVLAQSYRNIELIIVDDCSTDDTAAFLKSLRTTDTRVTCLFNEQQMGACASRNRAIANASGTFVTGLDDDDFFLADHLAHFLNQADRLSTQRAVGLFSVAHRLKPGGQRRLATSKSVVFRGDLIDGNFIGNQIFTSLAMMQKIGPFDIQLEAFQDLDMWYRMLELPSAYMQRTNQSTYVLDVSHGHGRISDRNSEKIEQAFEYFCQKHALTTPQRKVFSFQLCLYRRQMPPLSVSLRKLARNPDYENFRQCWYAYGDAVKCKLGF